MRPDIYLKKVNGQAVTLLASDPASDVQPCFSPDGKRIVFSSSRAGNWDLWMVGLDGGPARQITHSPMHEVHPSFSPDGKRLVFCVFNPRAEQWEMWVLQVDQPASAKMIGTGLFPRWSPTGESIVYQRARERGGRWFSIWRIDLESGEPKFPVELAASSDMALIQPTWSPDGQWIAYGTALLSQGSDTPDGIATVMSRGDVWVMRADGASPMQLTDGAGTHFSPAFGADGRVYFTRLQNGAENIWSVKPLLVPITPAPAASKEPEGGTPAKGKSADAVSMGLPNGR
jgi:TolB protein